MITMKYFSSLLCFIIFASFLNVNAQTVEEIVNKHLAAIGGKQVLSSIQSVKMENQMEVMGNDATTVITIVNGKGYKTESEIMGAKMVQVINEKGGWMINPMAGGSEAQDIPAEVAKQASNNLFIVPLLDHVARGINLSLEGKENIGGSEAFKMKVTNKEGSDVTMYIDATKFYLVRLVQTADMMGQTVTNTVTYSDFRKTESGWVVPYVTDMDMGGMIQLKNKLSKIEVNPSVDPSVFDKK